MNNTTTTTTKPTNTTLIEQHSPPSLAKMKGYWTNYVTLFQGWLYNDKAQLLTGMITHYQELQQLQITLQQKGYNVMETNDACFELENQIQQLEQKIRSIQGGAERLELAKQQSNESSNSTQQQQYSNQDKNKNESNQQSPSSSKKESIIQEDSKNNLNEMLPSAIASTLTNEQLAHEIILNPNFKLERHHQNSIERQVTDIATKAYFDKLAEDIEKGITKYNEIVPQLFYEIRERLNDLVAPSMKNELQEGIDIQLIKQQIEQKVFDLDKMIEFILDLIQRSCASIRDPTVQKIRSLSSDQQQEGVTIKQIQLIFDLLQEMALDLANHQLYSLRPHLLPIAIDYGRSKFIQAMQEQGIQNELPKTKQWLQKTIQQLQEKASQRNPENITLPPTTPLSGFQHQEIYEDAIVSLIMSSELIHSDMCPETLRLDIGRLHEYQNEAQAVTIVAALLMLTRNFGATQHDDNDALVKRLFILLEQQGTTVDHLATEIQHHCYTKTNDNNNEQEGTNNDSNEMIYAMVDKTLSHTDAIYSLLSRRVSRVIKTYINNNHKQQDQQQEDKKISDTILQSNGLYHVRKPLHDLCIRIAALTDYNYRVHNQWYKEQLELLL
ncbi:hypothetical protein INT45_005021 [Circinella minor]|uniref:Uncharacterized protein n=1 Tax=Circinella minor TaxID=1195481 RepID=A0A8H7VI84_9FUNG|nr:hypothetical protein INT45_005021 [Circinella minor]